MIPAASLPRLLGALGVLGLLTLGVVDMGERVDEVTLGLSECFADEAACVGQSLHLSYMRVVSRDDEGFVLRGRGFDMRVQDWRGPALPEGLALTRVSVSGRYQGHQVMSGERGMVHRFRRIKELVGILVLALWGLGLGRFCWGRLRG